MTLVNPHIGIPLEDFLRDNIRMIDTVANRYREIGFRKGFDYEDLFQCAYIGFHQAYERYNPAEQGEHIKFSSYAFPCMTGGILRMFRDYSRLIRVPHNIQELGFKILKANLKEASEEIIRAEFGCSLLSVKEAKRFLAAQRPISLQELVGEESRGEKLTVESLFPTFDDDSLLDFKEYYGTLPRRTKMIMAYRMDGFTQVQIAEIIGLSQMQVCRILKQTRMGYEFFLEVGSSGKGAEEQCAIESKKDRKGKLLTC